MIVCMECREDINAKGQDNVSPFPGYPICEDCRLTMSPRDFAAISQYLAEEECEEDFDDDF